MNKNYSFEDFKSVMNEAIANNNFLDFTDEQMRQVWADNFYKWRKTHSRKELQEALFLLNDYSNEYQADWTLSWAEEILNAA